MAALTEDRETEATEAAAGGEWEFTEDQLLGFAKDERKRSIGYGDGDDGELVARRERGLLYYKGDVSKDIESQDKRSKAVSTDVAEAIDTALPDLAEIFLSGENILTFAPEGEEDEDQARDETDFVQRTLFQSNPGFTIFTTAMKDALLNVTGLFHWWYEEDERSQQVMELRADQAQLLPAVQAQLAMADPATANQLQTEEREDGSTALSLPQLRGKICYKAIPPEDFTVSSDTVTLPETPYCGFRERAREQALIERGLDADKVRGLSDYSAPDQAVAQARDEAGENNRATGDGAAGLRTVEIHHHYMRYDRNGDGETELWHLVSDAEDKVLIDCEEIDHVPFSALTPYMSSHRFYGESVADRLLEIMRIKTTLLRMMLDSGYFALNQRMAVDVTQSNEFTIPDLLRNEPNMPVRTNGAQAVTPLQAGQLGFDVFSALEYTSVMGEQRTGIVRNAQGLNPDTLHDTAAGAMQLANAAQKRLRFIARTFAETGIKELCLGIHRTMRLNWTDEHAPLKGKFGKKWKSTQPHQWPEREDMEVHVGPVSKEHELAMLTKQMEIANGIIEMQGGTDGPFITQDNVHNLLTAWSRAAGQKAPEQYWTDPANLTPEEQAKLDAPKPDPEVEKVKAQAEADKMKHQSDAQLARERAELDAQLTREKMAMENQQRAQQAQYDHEARMAEHAGKMALERDQMMQELQLKRELMTIEIQLKRELGEAAIASKHELGAAANAAGSDGEVAQPKMGGEPG